MSGIGGFNFFISAKTKVWNTMNTILGVHYLSIAFICPPSNLLIQSLQESLFLNRWENSVWQKSQHFQRGHIAEFPSFNASGGYSYFRVDLN